MSTLLQPGTAAPKPGSSADASKDPFAGMTLLTAEGQQPRAKAAIEITKNALKRIRVAMAKEGVSPEQGGLRLGIQGGGCSGLSYTLEYADEKGKFDEVVEDKGVTVLVDPKAIMFILGTEMDYVEEKLESGFVFRNPNEKGRCGCGESFHV